LYQASWLLTRANRLRCGERGTKEDLLVELMPIFWYMRFVWDAGCCGRRRVVKAVSKVDPVSGSSSWRVFTGAFKIESDTTGTWSHVPTTSLGGPAVAARDPRLGFVGCLWFLSTTFGWLFLDGLFARHCLRVLWEPLGFRQEKGHTAADGGVVCLSLLFLFLFFFWCL
jgi:hypothetical protein